MKKYPHLPGCKCGTETTEDSFLTSLDKEHPWWISAPQYSNCFWLYINTNKRPHTLLEISKLLKTTIPTITMVEKSGIKKIKKRIKASTI